MHVLEFNSPHMGVKTFTPKCLAAILAYPNFLTTCTNPKIVQLTDVIYPTKCDDGTLKADSPLMKWSEWSLEASVNFGRPVNSALKYKSQLEEAGFVDVVQTELVWPLGSWPRAKELKELGIWTRENFLNALHAGSMVLFTKGLGWSDEEVEAFLVDVRKDIKNPAIHSYWSV
jgi:hypothetical protein